MNTADRRIQTVSNRYGVDNVAKLKIIQDKRRNTFASKRNTIKFNAQPISQIVDGSTLSVYRLNKEVADKWLNEYHPLKAPRGNLLSLGLVSNNMIYCLMTFKKPKNHKYDAELSRMWMLPTHQIINGYNILSEYASQFGLSNIVAYVNRTFENCSDYEEIGMNYIREIQRTKWWIKNSSMMSDASRRQLNMSVKQVLNEGWLPLYDCGQAVYEFK